MKTKILLEVYLEHTEALDDNGIEAIVRPLEEAIRTASIMSPKGLETWEVGEAIIIDWDR